MKRFQWIILLLLCLTSCVPTNNRATKAEMDMSESQPTSSQVAQPQSACPFVLALPDTLTVISSTVGESEASYQLLEPGRGVLSEVRQQLEKQGWTRTETTTDKLKGLSETLYTCTGGGSIKVKFGPIGKSRMYALRLTLE